MARQGTRLDAKKVVSLHSGIRHCYILILFACTFTRNTISYMVIDTLYYDNNLFTGMYS